MSTYLLTCRYCGNKEKVYLYHEDQDVSCSKCRDTNVKIEEPKEEDNNPFGYTKE